MLSKQMRNATQGRVSRTHLPPHVCPHVSTSRPQHHTPAPAPQQPLTQVPRPDVAVQMGRRSDKIAQRKGKSDAKKAKVYGRIGKKIVQIVKSGGPDPTANIRLADLLRTAKDLNVPKDIIDRNIKRASDSKQADYTEVCYEAYGPGGTAFIVECLTDNVNRSASEVKSVLTKGGCKIAEPGSVMFSFSRAGQIYVQSPDEDAVFEAAIEAGADDVAPSTDDNENVIHKVFTSVEAYVTAKAALAGAGFPINEEESGLVYKAQTPVEVDDETFTKCEALLDKLLDLDDVDGVYSSCDGLDA